jgi:hypothetical protein
MLNAFFEFLESLAETGAKSREPVSARLLGTKTLDLFSNSLDGRR